MKKPPVLENLKGSECKVYRYLHGHSLLTIEVVSPHSDEYVPKYLFFEGVVYMEGTVSWIASNFRIGSSEECLRLLHLHTSLESIPDDVLLSQFSLFIISTSQQFSAFKIIAFGYSVLDDAPFER